MHFQIQRLKALPYHRIVLRLIGLLSTDALHSLLYTYPMELRLLDTALLMPVQKV